MTDSLVAGVEVSAPYDTVSNHASESGRWLKLMNDIEHEPLSFEDYDRERRISATGAFGSVPYNAPAGSLE